MTEIQKMEDRARGTKERFAVDEQAADAWDAIDLDDLTPLAEWVAANASGPTVELTIPDQRPARLDTGGMFDQETVYFGKRRDAHVACGSRGTAELLCRMAELGVSDARRLPADHAAAIRLLDRLDHRHARARARLQELAASRGDADQQEQILAVLERWFVLGRRAATS